MELVFFMKSGLIIELPISFFNKSREEINKEILDIFYRGGSYQVISESAIYNIRMSDVSAFAIRIKEKK